jgi:hypothetical protein
VKKLNHLLSIIIFIYKREIIAAKVRKTEFQCQLLLKCKLINLFVSSSYCDEMTKVKNIAIYEEGGIGKSTTSSNLSASLSDLGITFMQFGCYQKATPQITL